MLDHITLGVNDLTAAKKFYDAVFATMGIQCSQEEKDDSGELVAAGYDLKTVFFWVCLPLDETRAAASCNGTHIALTADTKEQVNDFYDAALQNGGTDDGPPGLRPHYHDKYYAAFVRDPQGHKIEIVFGNNRYKL